MKDLQNLGQFNSVQELWEAHPEGGREGDYATINCRIKCRWNKYLRNWQMDIPTGSTESGNKIFDEDVSVNKNLTIGGDTRIKGNMFIGGMLYTKHVKQPNCGLFPTLDALKKQYPSPTDGMWAVIGNTIPGPIYRFAGGSWIATGEIGGVDTDDIDLSGMTESEMAEILDTIFGKTQGNGDDIPPEEDRPTDEIAYIMTSEFDVITSRKQKTIYENTIGTKLCDRPVGLRFCNKVPSDDYIIKIYMYSTRGGKKYIECGQCTAGEFGNPYNGTLFRTLPERMSLMNLFTKAWQPVSKMNGESDKMLAELWTALIRTRSQAYDMRHSSASFKRMSPCRNTQETGSLLWSASYGIRIFSPDGKPASGMKTFRIGVLKNKAAFFSFSMKNKL